MASRAFRSSAIGVTYIARQFGVQVNADAVEQAIQRGTLTKLKDFSNYFFDQGVLVKILSNYSSRRLECSDRGRSQAHRVQRGEQAWVRGQVRVRLVRELERAPRLPPPRLPRASRSTRCDRWRGAPSPNDFDVDRPVPSFLVARCAQ